MKLKPLYDKLPLSFDTLTIYAILKRLPDTSCGVMGFDTLTIYAILKHRHKHVLLIACFDTLTIYAILKQIEIKKGVN